MSRKTNDDEARDRVVIKLLQCGFVAEPVPESDTKLPDIRVEDLDEIVLVEVKTKQDAKGAIDAMDARLATGEVITIAEVLEYRTNLANVLHVAKTQLNTHPESDVALKVAWIECASWDAGAQFEDWVGTLYGTAFVVDETREVAGNSGSIFDVIATNLEAVHCDYFYESALFKFRRGIDGVLLDMGEERVLVLNDHSAQRERLHGTRFARELATRVIDVHKSPLDPARFLADCDGDRRDVDKTLRYIAEKYKLGRARLMPMTRYRLVQRLPRPLSGYRQSK